MQENIHVFAFAGSLRKASYNRALLKVAEEVKPSSISLEIFELDDIPLYNGDVEAAGFPPSVLEFKKRIEAADAVLIATPEYNYSIPGVLKNAIDWASRPSGKSSLNAKPVAIMGASMGMLGTARAQYHLRQVFVFNNMFPLNQPEVFVGQSHTKFDESGRLNDDIARGLIQKQLEALQAWTLRLRTST